MWGVIGCLFGRNIQYLLVFYGLYSYLPQAVEDNETIAQQAVAQLVLVLRGIYADCRQKYYFDAGQQRVEGCFAQIDQSNMV